MGDRIHSENYATEGYRKCGICGIEKHVSDFPRRMSGKYEGALLFCCAACNKERVHAWNKAHPGATAKRNHLKGLYLPYTESKDCHMWLGIHITEKMAVMYFKGYKQMPIGNPGFDLINPDGQTIDCKASHLRKVSNVYGWQFAIDRNIAPDKFFCVAFGDAEESHPVHAWIIPSEKISYLKRLSIYPGIRSISRWAQYEIPIDSVIDCWKATKYL